MEQMQPESTPRSPVTVSSNPTLTTAADSIQDIKPSQIVRSVCGCGGAGCSTCKSNENTRMAGTSSYVYVIGRIEPRYPDLSVEKEFAHAVGRAETVGLTDRQALRAVLQQKENRYLARQLCWILSIEGMESYLLLPRDMTDIDLLTEMLRSTPQLDDVDVVVGSIGPLAPSNLCNGLVLPTVAFDQVFSFDVESLIKTIPRPDNIPAEQFEAAAGDLFMRVMQWSDNLGTEDEHRALNFLAIRYPVIYAATAQAYGRNETLSRIEVRSSRLSGVRRVMDVVFSFTNRQTDVTEKLFVRVDTTGKFPFLVTKLSPYYDR